MSTAQPPARFSARAHQVVLRGLRSSLSTVWLMGKVMIPVYLGVGMLHKLGVLALLVPVFRPLMGLFGLPSEAALVLIGGYSMNIYAGIGALAPLHPTAHQVTVVGLMLGISHSLIVEWVVLRQMGARASRITLLRVIVSLITGAAYNLLVGEGLHATSVAHPAVVSHQLHAGVSVIAALREVALGCWTLTWKMVVIVTVIMIVLEAVKETGLFELIARRLAPGTTRLRVSSDAIFPLAVGAFFGIIYGGGALVQVGREGRLSRADVNSVAVFLSICHAIVEDTALFAILGASWAVLVSIRLALAVSLTFLLRTRGWV